MSPLFDRPIDCIAEELHDKLHFRCTHGTNLCNLSWKTSSSLDCVCTTILCIESENTRSNTFGFSYVSNKRLQETKDELAIVKSEAKKRLQAAATINERLEDSLRRAKAKIKEKTLEILDYQACVEKHVSQESKMVEQVCNPLLYCLLKSNAKEKCTFVLDLKN